MNDTLVYGDPSNIAMFEVGKPTTNKNTKQKILCTEDYKDELLQVYEEFDNNINYKNWNVAVGTIIDGKVSSITASDMIIDMGAKESVYISISGEEAQDYVIDEEVTCIVTSKLNGVVRGSISEYNKAILYEELLADDNDYIYDAYVEGLSENGYVLDIEGLKVFMPGSLGGINKLVDFNSLIGQTISVVTVKNDNKYSKFKAQLIVSHRDYLKSLIPEEVEKLVVGESYTGTVTDTSKFGVFVEFGVTNKVLTGLIHKDDFDDAINALFEKREIAPGTQVEFYLKEIVTNHRIILSRNPIDEEDIARENMVIKKGDVVEGKITKIVKYGAFVVLPNKKSGLIHINKLKNTEVSQGQVLDVRVLDIQGNKYDLTPN